MTITIIFVTILFKHYTESAGITIKMKRYKTIILLMVIFFMSAFYIFSAAPGSGYDFLYMNYENAEVSIPYRLYTPADYQTKKYPVILFLHGSADRGNDNEAQLSGFPYYFYAKEFMKTHPAIIILPQCPAEGQWVNVEWSRGDYSTDEVKETPYLKAVYELTLLCASDYNADLNRLYITGLSMGGYGTWDMIIRHTDIFAAALPICGGGDSSKAERIKDLPVWNFHGNRDPVVPITGSVKMAEALYNLNAENFKFTIYENGYHDAWSQTYSNTEVLEWLFSQTKSKNNNLSGETENTVNTEKPESKQIKENTPSAESNDSQPSVQKSDIFIMPIIIVISAVMLFFFITMIIKIIKF